MDERQPPVGPGRLEQQALGASAARIATPDEPRGEHTGVVGHEPIAGREQMRQIANPPLLPRATRPVDDEQARGAARARLLGDEVLGKIEVEI